jgi:hypothetical protein
MDSLQWPRNRLAPRRFGIAFRIPLRELGRQVVQFATQVGIERFITCGYALGACQAVNAAPPNGVASFLGALRSSQFQDGQSTGSPWRVQPALQQARQLGLDDPGHQRRHRK